jgi:hypothetical protein
MANCHAPSLLSAHVYKGLQTYIQMLDLSTGAIMIMTRERVKKLKELYICHLPPEIMEIGCGRSGRESCPPPS